MFGKVGKKQDGDRTMAGTPESMRHLVATSTSTDSDLNKCR